MTKDQSKKRKQDLGIFYTPQEVVDFIFDILNIWKNKEDKELHRWQTRKPRPHFPSVIDPACGEGVFLKTAVTSGFTGYHPTEKTPYVFGVDIDGEVVKRWEDISILHDLFKGKKSKMLNHFHQQDGLLELPNKVFNYKTGGLKEFDAVVGNPPYGGIGFSSLKEKSTSESIKILEHLKKFEILSYRKRKNGDKTNQTPLWGVAQWGAMPWGGGSRIPTNKEIESIPIEILFIDRFIQLAKPNSNSHYVREFISHRARVEAIVSLPRGTFKNAGTNAKTSILFLRKFKKGEKPKNAYPVFLASIEKINPKNFNKIVNSYKKFYNSNKVSVLNSASNSRRNHMDKSNLIQITKDQNKREVVMVRVDKTLKALMEEKPSSRWDPEFWHIKYENLFDILKHSKFRLVTLDEIMLPGIEGITYGQVGKRIYDKNGTIQYLQVSNVQITGVDTVSRFALIKENSHNDPARSRLKKLDLLLINGGVGSIGRSCVFVKEDGKFNISQDIDRIRFKNAYISFYAAIFLNSIYGQSQIRRYTKGVSGQTKIGFDQVRSIVIPLLEDNVLRNIEAEYKKMSVYHDNAMKAKKGGNEKEYKENLAIAEKMLKDLIKKTEEVIEGKRDDVI